MEIVGKVFSAIPGLHQLDYVLEEDFFPELLWVAPGAKAENKLVFFLIEDAVAAGTLASKLVRQATKWNEHEAFTLLRNSYVFNGPQTATILLGEISRIRLYLQARSYNRMYISCTSLKNVHEIYLKTAFDVHWYIHLTYNEKNQNVQYEYDLHCY